MEDRNHLTIGELLNQTDLIGYPVTIVIGAKVNVILCMSTDEKIVRNNVIALCISIVIISGRLYVLIFNHCGLYSINMSQYNVLSRIEEIEF